MIVLRDKKKDLLAQPNIRKIISKYCNVYGLCASNLYKPIKPFI